MSDTCVCVCVCEVVLNDVMLTWLFLQGRGLTRLMSRWGT